MPKNARAERKVKNLRRERTINSMKKGNSVCFLWGKIKQKKYARAYCEYHKCYLEGFDIREKKCNYKKCIYLKEIN